MSQSHRQQSKNRKNTSAAAAADAIKGVKGLSKYIQETTTTVQNIRDVFQHDLAQPNANVQAPTICRSRIQYLAEKTGMAHEGMVHHITLCDPSELVRTENELKECLAQLEENRKSFVHNSQQNKTTIRHIRDIIRQEDAERRAATVTDELAYELTDEIAYELTDELAYELTDELAYELTDELAYVSPVRTELNKLIENTKTQHKTVSDKILKQVRFNIRLTNSRVLAYQNAAETTIGKIIHHADKCRAFIARCRDLALIEFCASAWWMETQKDPMDHSYYYVSVIDVDATEHERDLDAMLRSPLHTRYNSFSEMTAESAVKSSTIRIVVEGLPTRENPYPVVAVYDMDQQFAETILTEEAVTAFRAEQGELCEHTVAARAFA
jgi:hypothetical protein